ncbi:MAG: DNA mismatch repair endonuclease MutL [Dehalococcoidia bacterium]|nr:DNA mismatch repair endonuclease MutL [Dehalococcoidia bacterium]
MSIRVLAPDVAGKIAAGEVAERPSLVVKELIENSLDAGATHITVEVAGGGSELLRVTDDGCGIPAEEVELAFQRHATSKITSAHDLDDVRTLGFRGEALPSIAAVARVSLVTRPAGAELGRRVELKGGRVVGNTAAGCPPGTSLAVQGLFHDLPARRKFLKSPAAETSRVSDMVSRFVLAYPEVRFHLLVNGRRSISSPGNGSLLDALASVYGADTASSLLTVDSGGPGDGYAVRGYISAPSHHRANRSYMTFLVNRRWVQSGLLAFALSESYQGFLPKGRHPLGVVNLTVPPADVDVNVHPAKREVRFRREDVVFPALQRAVRGALVATSPVPQVRVAPGPWSGDGAARLWSPGGRQTPGPAGSEMAPELARELALELGRAGESLTPAEATADLRLLGQVRNTYLVAEGPDGVYLIDQHAAHERVLFERIAGSGPGGRALSQSLLEPAAVQLSPGQEEVIRGNGDLLERYGFVVEPFGERSYLVRAVPRMVTDGDPARALTEILDLVAFERLLKEREDAVAASIACHSAVRAGKGLDIREMEELVAQLGACDSPQTCPHGRPTMIHLSSHHLEREFGRR